MQPRLPLIITDDNPRDREFLTKVFHDYELIETSNAAEAIEAAKNFDAPWVISDIQMPTANGIDLAKLIWRSQPLARIIFWSQYSDEMYLRSLVRIIPPDTVYGFVLKTNTADVLREAATDVFFQHQCWIDPAIRNVQHRLKHSHLTDAEYEVLIDIALGLTDKAIGLRRFLSRRGAQNRLKALYHKLEVDLTLPFNNEEHHLINLRNRSVHLAFQRGLVNLPILQEEEKKLQQWLHSERMTLTSK